MPAVPARISLNYILQDDRGFKASTRVKAFDADISTSTVTLGAFFGTVGGMGTAIQGASNAKVVSTGFSMAWDIAQEPSTETGTYQLAIQNAHLHFGDGTTLNEFLGIPAPKDGLFLTTGSDNLIVVSPTSALLTAIQSAASTLVSPAGGVVFSQFFGGQLRESKPRRRRVLQGA